jgi:hypothetical protein
MKAIQQHEIETVSGGRELWRPSVPAPAFWGSPMDGEWVWLLDEVPALNPIEPKPEITVCPPFNPDPNFSA